MHTRLQILIPLQRHFLMHCFLRKVSQARRGGTHFRTRKKYLFLSIVHSRMAPVSCCNWIFFCLCVMAFLNAEWCALEWIATRMALCASISRTLIPQAKRISARAEMKYSRNLRLRERLKSAQGDICALGTVFGTKNLCYYLVNVF